jgi:hypothetical protein
MPLLIYVGFIKSALFATATLTVAR